MISYEFLHQARAAVLVLKKCLKLCQEFIFLFHKLRMYILLKNYALFKNMYIRFTRFSFL